MSERHVDHNAIRVNQTLLISLLALAYVVDLRALVAFVAVVLLSTAAAPSLGLFTRIYRHILRPAGIVKPDIRVDNPEPHRFAQLVGGICLTIGAIGLLAGAEVIGWALAGMVAALASLNLFAGICVGCMMYYWFNRLGVPGFERAPINAEA
jgi:hypothetical protein